MLLPVSLIFFLLLLLMFIADILFLFSHQLTHSFSEFKVNSPFCYIDTTDVASCIAVKTQSQLL